MSNKGIVSVSELTISTVSDNEYYYGFTVLFEDGEIQNIMLRTVTENNDSVINALKLEQNKYINQITQKES